MGSRAAPPEIEPHPLRGELHQELHNRPSPLLRGPVQISHVAVLTGEGGAQEDLEHLKALARRYSVSPPAGDASCYYQDFGGFEVRWERHTEFSTYSFIHQGEVEGGARFAHPPLSLIPRAWLEGLPGQLIVGAHLIMEEAEGEALERDALRADFEGQRLICSHTTDQLAEVWTAFRLHGDDFGRILVLNRGLAPCQAGRLIQRLLELDTYRIMALLAYPLVRGLSPEVTRLNHALVSAVSELSEVSSLDSERWLVRGLSEWAARVEQIRAQTTYRVAATRAYADLVYERLEWLSEVEVDGVQSIPMFLKRRFAPAIKTCDSFQARLEDLSRRIDQASALLRARIDLTLESQNQRLLSSMDRRGQLQLRLQQTVEGLSVAAISYYFVGLLKVIYEALGAVVGGVSVKLLTGISVPLVVLGVWRLTRAIHAKVTHSVEREGEA